MLKKIFQSPLFNAMLIGMLGLIMIGNHYPECVPAWLVLDPMVLGIPILILLVFIPFYNKKHPADRIKPTLMPMEFREEDEGQQWITFKATRKVYIFFASIIPVAIATTAYLNHLPYLPVVLLAAMGVTQYVIYWTELRKHA
ncbi:hypothetical protein GKZ89_18640 [Bacillus mangrovi]|uniref:Uncharacterized protein n=1 Tax=Metabacillus mangrovi TaxID=1491830 RepID=A0A7X2S804_9BACI|nr:hypothetical protein [Metabacillus mangrovi]MTH55414.1 hypothetical protein [Metabacillus mangrovi]